jgi:hypothetical protein
VILDTGFCLPAGASVHLGENHCSYAIRLFDAVATEQLAWQAGILDGRKRMLLLVYPSIEYPGSSIALRRARGHLRHQLLGLRQSLADSQLFN